MKSSFPFLTASQVNEVIDKRAERDKLTRTEEVERLGNMLGVGAQTLWRWARPGGFPTRGNRRPRARLIAEAFGLGVSIMNEENQEVLAGGPVRLIRSLAGEEVLPFVRATALPLVTIEQCEEESRWPYSRRDREAIYKFAREYGVDGAPVDPMRGIHVFVNDDLYGDPQGCLVSFVWGLAPLLGPGQSAPIAPPTPEARVRLTKPTDWTHADMIVEWDYKPTLPDVTLEQFEDEAKAYATDYFLNK